MCYMYSTLGAFAFVISQVGDNIPVYVACLASLVQLDGHAKLRLGGTALEVYSEAHLLIDLTFYTCLIHVYKLE